MTSARPKYMKLLGKALNHLGSMLVTNVPISTGGHMKGPENDVASWDRDQLFEVQEGENSREQQFYHQFLDHNTEISDEEDKFQEYIWKVDKIVSHKLRGRQIFLHVIWKQGNRSWILLKSLRFQVISIGIGPKISLTTPNSTQGCCMH